MSSCLFCCFQCLVGIGCRDHLIQKYAFFPPNPSSYLIYQIAKPSENSTNEFSIIFYEEDGSLKTIPEIPGLKYSPHLYSKDNGKKGCGLLVEYTKIPNDYIIIFSHGNSTDIGKMIETLLDLSYNLKINVFCLEYTGFGHLIQQDIPSDENIINDICEAYKYIQNKLKFPWHKMILYGQSVGSGPSCFIASNKHFPIAGLILHSPILSGMRVLNIDLKKTPPNDFFPNIDLINYSRCPIFIIHGQDDEEVSIEHAKILFSKCHRPYEGWWAKDAGHNNIEIVQRKDFFKKCYLFIQTIKNADSNKSEKEILADNMAVDWEENFKHFYRKFLNKTEENLNKDSAVMMIESMSVKSNEMCQKNLIDKKSQSSKEEENKSSLSLNLGSSHVRFDGFKGKSRKGSSYKTQEVEFSSWTSSFINPKSNLNEIILTNTQKE